MVTQRITSAYFLFGLLVAALIYIVSSSAPVYAQGYPVRVKVVAAQFP